VLAPPPTPLWVSLPLLLVSWPFSVPSSLSCKRTEGMRYSDGMSSPVELGWTFMDIWTITVLFAFAFYF